MAEQPKQKFERFYAQTDFGLSTDTATTVAAGFQRVGSLTVGAQTLATFGAGAIGNGVDFRRNITVDFNSAAATPILNMRVRLAIVNAQETRKVVIAEELSQNLASGVALGEYGLKAKEDDKLIFEVLPAANVTIDVSESSMSVPTTLYQ